MVATVNLSCPLKLRDIALHARNAEYNPRRFAAVIIRLREPKTTALVFASGKMVCTGAANEQACRTAARKFARMIQKLGAPVCFNSFRIQNVVGSVDVGFPIDLERMSNLNNSFCRYEPEVFPGLIFKVFEPKLVVLMFVSGKMVFTGASSRADILTAYLKVLPLVEECRKQSLGTLSVCPN